MAKNVVTNTVTVAEGDENPALYQQEVRLRDVHFIDPTLLAPNSSLSVYARIRYRQPLAKACLTLLSPSVAGHALVFDHPVKFIASGQSAVFYSDEKRNLPAGKQVLGGGVIV